MADGAKKYKEVQYTARLHQITHARSHASNDPATRTNEQQGKEMHGLNRTQGANTINLI